MSYFVIETNKRSIEKSKIMQSVNLTQINLPQSAIQTSSRPENHSNSENTFSIKVKYLGERLRYYSDTALSKG